MALPDILGQQMDKADLFPYSPLVERIWGQVAIQVAGAEVGDHFRWWHDADLDVLIRIQAMFGHVVTQQQVVHGVFEGHSETEALPLLGIAFVLVLDVQHDGLAIDVFHRGHDEWLGGGARAHGHRQRHRR